MLSTPEHLRTIASPDGAVILNTANNQITTLNSMGSFIWNRLQEGQSVPMIVSEIVKLPGAESTSVEREVNVFVDDLRARSLLVSPEISS